MRLLLQRIRAKFDDFCYWFKNTTISPTGKFILTWEWVILVIAAIVSIIYPYIATFVAHNPNLDADSKIYYSTLFAA